MKPDSKLAAKIEGKEFIFNARKEVLLFAEYLPVAGTGLTVDPKAFGSGVTSGERRR
jgi:hypothetical protein